MEREEELALVTRLRSGDTTAFDAIFDSFHPRLLNFLTRMTRDRSVAEDLLEETWLRLISNSADLQPDTRLGPWLFVVARNLFLSYCRNRLREQSFTGEVSFLWPDGLPKSPFDLAAISQFEERLEQAIALLPAADREVLLLVGVEGLRSVDAAKVCRISPEAFRQRLSRARRLLLQLLDGSESRLASAGKEVTL